MSQSHWSVTPFTALYQSIASTGSPDQTLLSDLRTDLGALTIVPSKNAASRTSLESGKIKIGKVEYEVNQEFKIAAVELADELNIDELISAEFLLDEQKVQGEGITVETLKDCAKAAYYLRQQHILEIVSYIYNASPDNQLISTMWKKDDTVKSLLKSFQCVHEELAAIHQLVQKAKILEVGNTQDFKMKISFRRNSLQTQHDTLSEILYGIVSRDLLTVSQFKEFLNFLSTSYDVDDLFITHLLPSLVLFISKIAILSEHDVKQLHSDLIKDLKKDDAYKTPIKVLVILIFLTYFISWCKSSADRLNEFDFDIAVESPMVLAVQLGAIEQLLIINASIATIVSSTSTSASIEPMYDLRSLLEQHLPRLEPKRVLDINEEETRRLKATNPNTTSQIYIHIKQTTISDNLISFITSSLHQFTQSFISDAAFLLIKLKDQEEDLLLSSKSEEVPTSLESISKRADLERFYLAVYYLYNSRSDLISEFWEDRESNAFGFITWASKASDPLLMKCAFLMMVSALTKGGEEEKNSMYVYHFIAGLENCSWSKIYEDFKKEMETLKSMEVKDGEVLNISEETSLKLSSYFNIIYSVALNGNNEIRSSFDSILLDSLFEFLKLDTVLVGQSLRVISSLVCKERRAMIWENIDIWLFGYQFGSFKEAFQARLTAFPDVVGFIELLETLLSSNDVSYTGKYELPYPQELGYQRRKAGISPYLEFLLSDVLYHSHDLYFEEQLTLQEPILKIMVNCLSQFDPKLILMSFPASVNLNNIVGTGNFAKFVQTNPAPVALSLLFQGKVARCLLDVVATGSDDINDKLATEKQVQCVDLALTVLGKIFDLEVTYFDELLPILRKHNCYLQPSSFGVIGMNSFYEILLSNLPVVAHLALYVGSKHLAIASKSIKLLKMFAKSQQLGNHSPSKLLTILDSVNESLRIKHGFIDQLASPDFINESSVILKLDILQFINDNLAFTDKSITISHFLLGFDVRNGISLGSKQTFIGSSKSLLSTIIFILESSYLSLNSHDIEYPPSRFASLSLEILLKLCRGTLSSELVLEHLRGFELLDKLLETPRIDQRTLWSGTRFNPEMAHLTKFNSSNGIGAFLALLNQRNFILQYLSLELHRTSISGSISKTRSYIKSLINGNGKITGPPKVLSLIDVLDFSFTDLPIAGSQQQGQLQFFENVDLNFDLNHIKLSNNVLQGGQLFNLEEVDVLLDLHLRELAVQGLYHTQAEQEKSKLAIAEFKNEIASSSLSLVKLPVQIHSNEGEVLLEKQQIKSKLTNHLASLKFKTYQLSALHSWCQLISVIVTDGKLSTIERPDFILEVFQCIVPRINEYFEKDVFYAEELVSLCVSLYDMYHKDREVIEQGIQHLDCYERLYPLFKSCIQGILSPSSSLSLRSDLYVLANKYLTWVLQNKDVSRQILQSLKISTERLITIVCNDSISGEGSTRITGLLLLESLYKLSNMNQLNLVLNILVKNNMLLLLVKSIRRTDQTLILARDNNVTLQSLLYELTAFKATLSFLIRVAETRTGAQQLLQSEVFQTIKACSFLEVDPDLGLDLIFEEVAAEMGNFFVKVNLNLDSDLTVSDNSKGSVSLIELLIPVFQLISAILLSTSSENTLVIQQVRKLLVHFNKLIVGVLKRDVLVEAAEKKEQLQEKSVGIIGLKELVNLFILLSTLTKYKE